MKSASESKNSLFSVHSLVLIAMLSALAFVLMFFEFPILFLAPGFYKMDFSELPVLIGAFSLGPMAGVIIEALKILLHLLFKSTSTAFVGEIANFLVGIALVVPAALVYQVRHTKTGALLSIAVGIIVMVIVGVLVNAFLLLPWYAQNMFGSLDPILQAGKAIWPAINGLMSFALLIVAPFNLFKGVLVGILTMLLYKRVSHLISRIRSRHPEK